MLEISCPHHRSGDPGLVIDCARNSREHGRRLFVAGEWRDVDESPVMYNRVKAAPMRSISGDGFTRLHFALRSILDRICLNYITIWIGRAVSNLVDGSRDVQNIPAMTNGLQVTAATTLPKFAFF